MSQYGYSQGYGQQVAQPSGTGAMIRPPSLSDLGGSGQQPWIQFPFFPTAPFVSKSPNVDSDYIVNSEAVRTIQFDIPCRVIAINGGGVYYDAANNIQSLPEGYSINDLFLFRLEYTTGDKLHTGSRLASTCIGNAQNPGEIGGVGFTVDQGSSIQLIITPLISNLRIDITLHCLEIRGQRNFN